MVERLWNLLADVMEDYVDGSSGYNYCRFCDHSWPDLDGGLGGHNDYCPWLRWKREFDMVELFIGQTWRHKRKAYDIQITQIHRKDRVVQARLVSGMPSESIPFGVLRLHYRPTTIYVPQERP